MKMIDFRRVVTRIVKCSNRSLTTKIDHLGVFIKNIHFILKTVTTVTTRLNYLIISILSVVTTYIFRLLQWLLQQGRKV